MSARLRKLQRNLSCYLYLDPADGSVLLDVSRSTLSALLGGSWYDNCILPCTEGQKYAG